MDRPIAVPSFSATILAITSVPPPAGQGTTMRIGFDG
jgi:hypothetical protein